MKKIELREEPELVARLFFEAKDFCATLAREAWEVRTEADPNRPLIVGETMRNLGGL